MKNTTVMFQPLDDLMHSELRLAIMNLLVREKKIDFRFILEKTGGTAGNISIQMNKLYEGGYLSIEKTFKNNYPCTTLKVTAKGALAYKNYVEAIKPYLEGAEHT